MASGRASRRHNRAPPPLAPPAPQAPPCRSPPRRSPLAWGSEVPTALTASPLVAAATPLAQRCAGSGVEKEGTLEEVCWIREGEKVQRDKGKGNGGRCGRQHVGVGSSVLIKIDRVSPNLRSPAKTSFRHLTSLIYQLVLLRTS